MGTGALRAVPRHLAANAIESNIISRRHHGPTFGPLLQQAFAHAHQPCVAKRPHRVFPSPPTKSMDNHSGTLNSATTDGNS